MNKQLFYRYVPVCLVLVCFANVGWSQVGDANGDGVTDASDVSLIRGQFGRSQSDSGWDSRCDLDADRRVTSADVALALRNFGSGGSTGGGPTTTIDYSQAPVAEFRAARFRSSYDYITLNGMRAMYVFDDQYNNTNLINDLKNNGMNALIAYVGDVAHSESGFAAFCDGWKSVQDRTGMKVYFTVDFGGDSTADTGLSNTQFGAFVSDTGGAWYAPDPLSRQYWKVTYGDRVKVAVQKGLAGGLIDMEMYRVKNDSGVPDAVFRSYSYSDYCWNLFCDNWLGARNKSIPVASRHQFLIDNNVTYAYANFHEIELMKILEGIRSDADAINPDFALGYILYFEMSNNGSRQAADGPYFMQGLTRGLGTPTQPALVLDETNYNGKQFVTPAGTRLIQPKLTSIFRDGYSAMLINGISPREQTPDGMKDHLLRMNSINYNGNNSDGYFVWCSYAYFDNPVDNFYKGIDDTLPADYVSGLGRMNAAYTR